MQEGNGLQRKIAIDKTIPAQPASKPPRRCARANSHPGSAHSKAMPTLPLNPKERQHFLRHSQTSQQIYLARGICQPVHQSDRIPLVMMYISQTNKLEKQLAGRRPDIGSDLAIDQIWQPRDHPREQHTDHQPDNLQEQEGQGRLEDIRHRDRRRSYAAQVEQGITKGR